MCVIIHKPKGEVIEEKDIIAAAKRNPHGFGYMYFDPEKKKIIVGKHLFEKPEDLLETFKAQEEYEVVYHLRIRTHGTTSEPNCHPFKILSKEKNGIDVYFMHNGMINKVKEEGDESDTRAFNRQFLRPMLKQNPDLVNSESFQRLVEAYIGHSKFVFIYGDGEIVKFNEELGCQHKGMWWSNKLSYATTTTNTHNQYGRNSWKQQQKEDEAWADNWVNGNQGYKKTESKKASNVADLFKNTSTKILKEDVKVGDEINVLHDTDAHFIEVGKVKNLFVATAVVEFMLKSGKKDTVTFHLPDGKAFSQMEGYQLLPFIAKPETCGLYKDEKVRDSFHKTITLPAIEDKSQKKEDNTFEVFRKEEQRKEVKLNTKEDRWGGGFVDDSSCDYDGTSILDFHEMSPQDRLNFFLDKIPQAFGMLQDLAERLFLDDKDEGLFDEDEIEEEGKSA